MNWLFFFVFFLFFFLNVFAQSFGFDLNFFGLVIPLWSLFVVFVVCALVIFFDSRLSLNRFEWKAFWFFTGFFLGPWGLVLYFFLGRKKRVFEKPVSESKEQEFVVESKEQPVQATGWQENGVLKEKEFLQDEKQVEDKESEKRLPSFFSRQEKLAKKENVPVEGFGSSFLSKGQPLGSGKGLSLFDLTEDEKLEVQQLIKIISSEKHSYSKDEIMGVLLEKGYSLNVAKKVVSELFG